MNKRTLSTKRHAPPALAVFALLLLSLATLSCEDEGKRDAEALLAAFCNTLLEPAATDIRHLANLRFGAESIDNFSAFAADAEGSLIVAGSFRSRVSLAGMDYTSPANPNTGSCGGGIQSAGCFQDQAFIAKLSPDLGFLWVRPLDFSRVDGLEVAEDGSVFARVLENSLLKLSASGEVLWTTPMTSTGTQLTLESLTHYGSEIYLAGSLFPSSGASCSPADLPANHRFSFGDAQIPLSDCRTLPVILRVDAASGTPMTARSPGNVGGRIVELKKQSAGLVAVGLFSEGAVLGSLTLSVPTAGPQIVYGGALLKLTPALDVSWARAIPLPDAANLNGGFGQSFSASIVPRELDDGFYLVGRSSYPLNFDGQQVENASGYVFRFDASGTASWGRPLVAEDTMTTLPGSGSDVTLVDASVRPVRGRMCDGVLTLRRSTSVENGETKTRTWLNSFDGEGTPSKTQMLVDGSAFFPVDAIVLPSGLYLGGSLGPTFYIDNMASSSMSADFGGSTQTSLGWTDGVVSRYAFAARGAFFRGRASQFPGAR